MENLFTSALSCQRIAHRGGGWLAPENTLAGFQAGLQAGFRAFECDVKLSADGVPFLLHDDLLDRTTEASGRASRQAWARLAQLDAGTACKPRLADQAPPGEGRLHTTGSPQQCIASLQSVAALLAGRDIWLNLEIKTDADASATRQAEWGARIAQVATRLWADAAQPPCLSSFSIPALQGAMHAAPLLPRAWLCEALPPHWREPAQALALRALHLDARACTPELVPAVHAAGLQLRVYTVNDTAALAQWCAAGVDGIFTDALELGPGAPPAAGLDS
jgi:glycerophosphoryl diester phosphodiesterase